MGLFRITSSLETMTHNYNLEHFWIFSCISQMVSFGVLLYIGLSVCALKLIFIANDQTCSMNSVLLQSLSLDQNPAISNTDNLAGDVPEEFGFLIFTLQRVSLFIWWSTLCWGSKML